MQPILDRLTEIEKITSTKNKIAEDDSSYKSMNSREEGHRLVLIKP